MANAIADRVDSAFVVQIGKHRRAFPHDITRTECLIIHVQINSRTPGICRNQDLGAEPADVLFRVLAFRFFSLPQTWEAIISYLGRQPTIHDLDNGQFEQAVEHAKVINGTLYTGAFILCAIQAYGFKEKYRNHIALFKHMFITCDLASQLLAARSLSEIYLLLHSFPLIGDFMAYQLAIDLNYTAFINFEENSFTKAGPGALRGMRKAFESRGLYSPEEIILLMVKMQDEEFKRLNLKFSGLNGRKLQAIDCQGLFCELDKYCRVAAPNLASNRNRIKVKHKPNGQSIEYFYPPKWTAQS